MNWFIDLSRAPLRLFYVPWNNGFSLGLWAPIELKTVERDKQTKRDKEMPEMIVFCRLQSVLNTVNRPKRVWKGVGDVGLF
jgi:hypothetical protein